MIAVFAVCVYIGFHLSAVFYAAEGNGGAIDKHCAVIELFLPFRLLEGEIPYGKLLKAEALSSRSVADDQIPTLKAQHIIMGGIFLGKHAHKAAKNNNYLHAGIYPHGNEEKQQRQKR